MVIRSIWNTKRKSKSYNTITITVLIGVLHVHMTGITNIQVYRVLSDKQHKILHIA